MGLISRVSSRTYRNMTRSSSMLIMAILFSVCVAQSGVKDCGQNSCDSALKDIMFRDGDFPMLLLIFVGVAVGLIGTVWLITYAFSLEDPSKTNIVYKLSYQRLKTE